MRSINIIHSPIISKLSSGIVRNDVSIFSLLVEFNLEATEGNFLMVRAVSYTIIILVVNAYTSVDSLAIESPALLSFAARSTIR